MKEFIRSNPPRFAFILGAVLVVLLLVVGVTSCYLYNKNNKDVLVKIGSKKITVSDLNKQIYSVNFQGSSASPAAATDDTKKFLLTSMVENEIATVEAKKLGITATDEEISAYLKENVPSFDSYTQEQKDLARENAKNEIIKQKVKDAVVSWRSGSYLVFNFHKYMTAKSTEYKVDGMGDAAKIAAQKTAASALATKVSDDLKAKKITYEQALETLKNDPSVGEAALAPRTPVMFGDFTKDNYFDQSDILDKDALLTAVSKMSDNEISNPLADSDPEFYDGADYRYIVFVIKGASAGTYRSWNEFIATRKTELGVKSNTGLFATTDPLLAKLSGVAQAAPAGCHACDADNANIQPMVYYRSLSGTDVPLVGMTVSIFGAGTGDPALAGDVSNAGCGGRIGRLDTVSKANGDAGLCANGYSYFCDTGKIAYIKLGRVPASLIPGSDPTKGDWAVFSSMYKKTWYHEGSLHVEYLDFTGGNGKQITNKFLWTPVYPVVENHSDAASVSINKTSTTITATGLNTHVPGNAADTNVRYQWSYTKTPTAGSPTTVYIPTTKATWRTTPASITVDITGFTGTVDVTLAVCDMGTATSPADCGATGENIPIVGVSSSNGPVTTAIKVAATIRSTISLLSCNYQAGVANQSAVPITVNATVSGFTPVVNAGIGSAWREYNIDDNLQVGPATQSFTFKKIGNYRLDAWNGSAWISCPGITLLSTTGGSQQEVAP